MNTTNDRNSYEVKTKDQSKQAMPAQNDPKHFQSGERTFTEPDNPPERKGGPKTESDQQTGGPGKPTA